MVLVITLLAVGFIFFSSIVELKTLVKINEKRYVHTCTYIYMLCTFIPASDHTNT